MDKKERLNAAYEYLRFLHVIGSQADVAEAMKTTRPNVSSALKGRPSVLTDSFLSRFCDCYDDYINRRWLLFEEGEMKKNKKEKPTASEDEQVDKIILLYSHLIKEIEDLRKELTIEIEQTRQVRTQLMAACSEIQGISTSFQQVFSSSANAPLLAADKPNVYPNPQKDET